MDLSQYIGNKIKAYRKQRKLTQSELGEKIGATKSRISNYERGYRTPQQDDLFALAQALEISVNDLFPPTTKKGDIVEAVQRTVSQLSESRQNKVLAYAKKELDSQNQVKEVGGVYKIEDHQPTTEVVLLGSASAGTGEILQDEHEEVITVRGEVPVHDFALKVVGNSMEPALQDGEVIFIEKSETARNGQIVIANLNGEAYVKKLYYREGRVKLISLNEDYEDIVLKEGDDFAVMGVVLL